MKRSRQVSVPVFGWTAVLCLQDDTTVLSDLRQHLCPHPFVKHVFVLLLYISKCTTQWLSLRGFGCPTSKCTYTYIPIHLNLIPGMCCVQGCEWIPPLLEVCHSATVGSCLSSDSTFNGNFCRICHCLHSVDPRKPVLSLNRTLFYLPSFHFVICMLFHYIRVKGNWQQHKRFFCQMRIR